MKYKLIALLALLFGVLASEFMPLVTYVKSIDAEILINPFFVLPCLFALILLVIKHNHVIATYTDEYLPFQLSVLSLILTIVGLLVFSRIMILGLLFLIASAHWSNRTVQQYYPRKRRV